jgi:hypothetical protein
MIFIIRVYQSTLKYIKNYPLIGIRNVVNMYILNLVLGCWVIGDNGDPNPGEFLDPTVDPQASDNLKDLVASWNKAPNKWEDVHYPAIPEHFEVYEKLPDNWRSYDKAEVS